jgi:predicted nucleic acid-binding protein
VVIVDTTVWVDYVCGVRNAETGWLHAEFDRRRIGLTDVILCEVLQGVRDDALFGKVLNGLLLFEVCATGGIEVAVAATRNYRLLRRRGHSVRKTIDCLTATFCLLNGHSLLHRDRDFDPFEKVMDLSVVHA